jgi:hypothetical protein
MMAMPPNFSSLAGLLHSRCEWAGIACFAVSRHLEGWKKQHYQLDRRSNRSLESIGKMQVGASR